jgi:hypothetical protein
MDGVCLSEVGLHQIKSLTLEQQQQSRKKRITKKIPTKADKEAGILATIESVVAGGSLGESDICTHRCKTIKRNKRIIIYLTFS